MGIVETILSILAQITSLFQLLNVIFDLLMALGVL